MYRSVAVLGIWSLHGLILLCAMLAAMQLGSEACSSRLYAAEAASKNPDAELAQRVDRLIEQLGDDHYPVRQRAQEQLAELGAAAFDALSAAETNRDLEIANRARYLIQQIRVDWIRDKDSPQIRKLLEGYDKRTEAERLVLMADLARLPDAIGLGPLCGLVRFERSTELSKRAALLILKQKRPTKESWPARAKTISTELALSRRASVRWLQTHALYAGEPREALNQWKTLVDDELRLLRRSPSQLQREVVSVLLREQMTMLGEQGEREQSLVVMRKLLEYENSDVESLTRLIDWSVQHSAWELLDELARQFDLQIINSSELSYALAQARMTQGNSKLADELAAKAAKLQPANPDHHLKMAYWLNSRGLAKWCEFECDELIKNNGVETPYPLIARLLLAEVLHDAERDGEAADALQGAVDAMEKSKPAAEMAKNALGRNPQTIRARLNFYRAKQLAKSGDAVREVEHLEQALVFDPTDADVLIALFLQKNPTDEQRGKTKQKIGAAASFFKRKIAANPDDAQSMNQYAWLIGNTEGDFDDAIKLSHRSLEIKPDTGGYLDTLAHCYASKQDYQNALKYQLRAAELEPHSQEIKRSLEKFKQAAEKKSSETGS